jgi:hypothetical protein
MRFSPRKGPANGTAFDDPSPRTRYLAEPTNASTHPMLISRLAVGVICTLVAGAGLAIATGCRIGAVRMGARLHARA